MIGDYSVTDQSIDNIYQNGLLTRPTTTHSMFRSAQGGFITGYKFIEDIYRKHQGLPEDNQLKDTLAMINREKSVEGIGLGQNIGNWVADVVGYSLSPPVLALGGFAGASVRAAGIGARAIAPKAVIPFLDRQVGKFTVGQIGERLATGAAIGEFTAIPLAFEEGSANVAHAMGGLGLAIGAIPVLWGLRKGLKSKVIPEAVVTEGEAKPLSEMEQWSHDLKNKSVPMWELESRATKILQKEGFEVNPVTHEVEFKLFDSKDVKNLQTAVTDSIASDMDTATRNHLIDYIIENKIDQIRSNPKSGYILKAYDNYLTGKLANESQFMESAVSAHFRNMNKKIKNNAFLSQQEMYKVVKKLSKEESNVLNLPFKMPESLSKRLRIEDRIKELKQKTPNRQVQKRIEELEKKLPKVLSPKEELKQISKKLLTDKEYLNPLNSSSYQRLLELSEHWPQAKSLLELVRVTEQFARQKEIKKLIDKIKVEIERPVASTANIDKLTTYLAERAKIMEPKKTTLGSKIKTPEQNIADAGKVPADVEKTLSEQAEFVEKLSEKAPKLKEEYMEIHNKIRQFKKSEKVLEDYIQCVLGAV